MQTVLTEPLDVLLEDQVAANEVRAGRRRLVGSVIEQEPIVARCTENAAMSDRSAGRWTAR